MPRTVNRKNNMDPRNMQRQQLPEEEGGMPPNYYAPAASAISSGNAASLSGSGYPSYAAQSHQAAAQLAYYERLQLLNHPLQRPALYHPQTVPSLYAAANPYSSAAVGTSPGATVPPYSSAGIMYDPLAAHQESLMASNHPARLNVLAATRQQQAQMAAMGETSQHQQLQASLAKSNHNLLPEEEKQEGYVPTSNGRRTLKRSIKNEEEDHEDQDSTSSGNIQGPVKKRLKSTPQENEEEPSPPKRKDKNSARSRFNRRASCSVTTEETASEEPQEEEEEEPSPECTKKGSHGDEQWNAMFQRLLDYKAVHGNCLVPQRCETDPKLGKWVCYQRKRRSNLSEDRRRRLEEIGFVFCVRNLEPWDTMFEHLMEYKKLHGDCLVPQNYKANPKLGKWVAIQRIYKDSLTPERMQRMEDVGFVWSVNQALWETMFESLVEYKNKNGHCRVPWNYRPDPQLANWVQRQRKNKKRLLRDRLERLQDIGLDI